jgi:hypothetical protein
MWPHHFGESVHIAYKLLFGHVDNRRNLLDKLAFPGIIGVAIFGNYWAKMHVQCLDPGMQLEKNAKCATVQGTCIINDKAPVEDVVLVSMCSLLAPTEGDSVVSTSLFSTATARLLLKVPCA